MIYFKVANGTMKWHMNFYYISLIEQLPIARFSVDLDVV